MMDLDFIRQNKEKVEKAIKDKGYKVDLAEILKIDEAWREKLKEVEKLRARRNEISADKNKIEEGKKIKEQLKKLEPELEKIEKQLAEKTLYIPNLPAEDVPVGKDEKDNVVIRKWGKPRQGEVKDHIELGKTLDIIDIEQAAQISGSRFYYLKGKAVELEWALVNWILDLLKKEGFIQLALLNNQFWLITWAKP